MSSASYGEITMAAFTLLWTAFLLASVHEGNAATLTVSPSTLQLSGNVSTGTVTLRCTPDVSTQSGDLIYLAIFRHPYSSSDQRRLAFASIREGYSAKEDENSPVRNGDVTGGINEAFVLLTMPETTCGADEATYVCSETSFKDGSPEITENSKNLTVEVVAGSVDITAEPLLSVYQVNTTLILNCNGQIGSVEQGVQITWVWQYKGFTDFAFINYDRREDIIDGPVNEDLDNICQRRQTSTLTRTLTLEDSGREYRCFVQRNNFPSEPDAQHLAKYLIQNVVSEMPDSGGGTGGSTGGDTPQKADVGPIIGGVIAALVVIIIVVVLVYFLVIRKRRQKAEAYPGEGSKPVDETGPAYGAGYPSNNADVTYSKPSRFPKHGDRDGGIGDTRTRNQDGLHYADLEIVRSTDDSTSSRGVTNKAMDDHKDEPSPGYDRPHYESKPARYENERDRNLRQGNRNPGYTNDDDTRRPRRSSSDDGGTDRSVNISWGDGDPTMGTAI